MRFTAVTTATTEATPCVVRSTDDTPTGPVSPRWWAPGLIALGALGAAIAVSCSSFVFPYLSSNSDEGAYLAQAETMASGHLFSDAPAVGPSAFRPWLAVARGHRFVFKFTPIHAGLLAAADVVAGSPRVALALIAAADVVLLALLVRALGGSARASLGAGLLLAICPAWIVQSGVYLPYLSSLALLLAAALCLAKGAHTARWGWYAAAGGFWGLAFMGRQYDAVLLLVPLALVAVTSRRPRVGTPGSSGMVLLAAFAAGVAPCLILLGAYDHAATGSVLRLPFNLITSQDGVGFGRHRVQPHDPEINYTVKTAIHASLLNGRDLVKGVAGSVVLLGIAAWGVLRERRMPGRGFFVALGATWLAGYLLFWGTYAVTVLSDINSFLGPIYYVPALAAAVAICALTLDRMAERRPRLALGLAAAILVVSAITTVPLLHNDRHRTDVRRAAAAEINRRVPPGRRSLLLVSPVRGPFVGHPFSWLRNRPDLRGDRLVAVEDPTTDFALIDRHRDRSAYFMSLINLQPVPTARALVDQVQLVGGRRVRIRCSGATPGPGSTRTIAVGLDGAGERERNDGASTFDIDVTSHRGRITVDPTGFHVPPLSSTGPVSTVRVAFRDRDGTGAVRQSVRRIPVRIAEGRLQVLLPGIQILDELSTPVSITAAGPSSPDRGFEDTVAVTQTPTVARSTGAHR